MPASPSLVWAHPDAPLWVAVGSTVEGDSHAGVVERVAGSFVAVDGLGTRLGAFRRREEASSAVRAAWARGTGRPSLQSMRSRGELSSVS
ncbi:hypothetical protein [Labedella populi]|uniref:hypothetical protein n=1 Tax=Labedella populi TaxID=2498850 RepID=UPI00140D1CF4|nr:hypothetical protein [Labedella populi]